MTDPGVHTMDEATYHAHPALSSTGARRLLPPSCPARFKWERDHGRPEKRTFDFGHAAHAKVLGIGAPVVVVQKAAKDGTLSDAEDYRTKSAQEHRDALYAEGNVPLLAAEVEQVDAMAEALLADPVASTLFVPEGGTAEQSLFWRDDRHGVERRARLDWLPHTTDGQVIVTDYKTTISAEPSAVAKTIASYCYHQQSAWYIDAVHALELAEQVGFIFVFQEKTPPYLVTVVEPDQISLRIGRALNDQALEVYAECQATDTWPGYTTDVELVSLPAWAIRDFQLQEMTT